MAGMNDFSSNPEAVERIAEACRPVAEGDPRVLGAYLFGSRASGETHEGSDVDLGVLFSEAVELEEQLRLERGFEEALAPLLSSVDVDLVDLGRCNAFLALDAIRGERIYERDGEACDHFDLYVMARAADLAPFERERRRRMLDPTTVVGEEGGRP